MIGKILTQIAIGVGIDVLGRQVIPKMVSKAKEKLAELQRERAKVQDAEEITEEEPTISAPKKAKVYTAHWE